MAFQFENSHNTNAAKSESDFTHERRITSYLAPIMGNFRRRPQTGRFINQVEKMREVAHWEIVDFISETVQLRRELAHLLKKYRERSLSAWEETRLYELPQELERTRSLSNLKRG